MNTFISTKQVLNKSIVMGGILLALAIGLYLRNTTMGPAYAVESFRMYHLKAYTFGIAQTMRNIFGNDVHFSRASDADPKVASSVPVLLYHGVLSESDGENIDIDIFKEQMKALYDAGYQAISLADFTDFVHGKKEVPDRSFLIFFDDGRKDSYYPTEPILKSLGYHAAMAVILDRTKEVSTFHLTIDELKRMQKSGHWHLASHGDQDHDPYPIDSTGTMGHFLSNLLWLPGENRMETIEEYGARVESDLANSRRGLEKIFGGTIHSFVPPFGDLGQTTVNLPNAPALLMPKVTSTYATAFRQMSRGGGYQSNYPAGENFYLANRILVQPHWSGTELVRTLESVRSKDPSYTPTPPGTIDGWVTEWGKFVINPDNTMEVGADIGKTGGSTFLEGSYHWTDYHFTATVDWKAGSNALIMARYKSDLDYVACSYGSSDLIHIQQSINGEQRVIAGVNYPLGQPPHNNMQLGIKVEGRKVSCLLNGEVKVTTPFLDRVLNGGGIGFKSWDARINHSKMAITSISVTPIEH